MADARPHEAGITTATPGRLTIGVMGSSSGELTETAREKAHSLGIAIAAEGAILITGACPGLPYDAVHGAKTKNGLVVGISPGLSIDEHRGRYGAPVDGFDVLIYTGSGLMGREITNIRSCDIVVVVGGRTGTLGELAIAYDEGRLIGVLTGTGGLADFTETLLGVLKKDTGACVLYDDDPARLVARLVHVYRTEHHRKPSCFCETVKE